MILFLNVNEFINGPPFFAIVPDNDYPELQFQTVPH